MSLKIMPDKAKNKIEDYIKELERLKKISYSEGKNKMYSVDANIKSFLTVAFDNAKERNRDYQGIAIAIGGLPPEKEQEFYISDLDSRIRTLKSWIEEMKLIIETSSSSSKVEKIKEVEKNNNQSMLKIFLSYSSLDYDLAKQLKLFLEEFGVDVFLAHTSIEPTRAWEEEIYKNLKECDVFMPFLTNNFKGSKWADQECGIAYNEKKKILSLMVDLTPYGFLGKFQALRINTSKFNWNRSDSRAEIINFLDKEFPNEMRESILSSIHNTTSWIIGTTKFRILREKEPFTEEEINKIIGVSSENNQIYDAEEVKPYLTELIEKYKDKIRPEVKEKIGRIIRVPSEAEIEQLIDKEAVKDPTIL